MTDKIGLGVEEKRAKWREKKAKQQEALKREKKREELEAKGENVDWAEFKEHVREEALKGDAPAGIMGIYRDLLKLSLPQNSNGISPDEMVKRNLEAERQLEEWFRGRDGNTVS